MCIFVLLAAGAGTGWAQPAAQTTQPQSQEAAPGADEAIDTLLRILKDDQQRTQLIDRLESEQQRSEPEQNRAAQPPVTFSQRVADATAGAAEKIYDTGYRLMRDFAGISSLLAGIPEQRQERIRTNGPPLAATVIVTIVLLRLLTARFSSILKRRPASGVSNPALRVLVAAAVNTLSDALALGAAYAVGLGLAIGIYGESPIPVEISLYLQAFMTAGLFRIFIRIFVLPDRPEQAVFDFSGSVQRLIHNWLVGLTGLLVYGIAAAVPIVNQWTGFVVGRSVRAAVVTLAMILAFIAIRQIAAATRAEQRRAGAVAAAETPDDEADSLGEALSDAREAVVDGTVSIWSRIWPTLAALYVIGCYAVAITRPSLMADLVGVATFQTIIAAGVFALALRFMRHAASAGVPISGKLATALPGLKERLDRFLPLALNLIAIALFAVATLVVIDGWKIVDVGSLVRTIQATGIPWRVVSALMIVVLIVVAWAVTVSWIDSRLTLDLPGTDTSARTRTLLSLFKSAFSAVVLVLGAMIALSQFGIDIAPLLAGAGVVGLAVGFGAQKMVQDVITGVFIQVEDAINQGDVITAGGITGTVERLTIRSVGMRDLNGIYHIVPFSAVDTVSNFMRKFAYHVADIGVAYREDISEVKALLQTAFDRLGETEHANAIIGPLEMFGVNELADSAVIVRVRIKTRPGAQWAIGRAYNEIVKAVLDEAGVEIPFPHMTIYMGQDKDGGAPPIRVATDSNAK